MKKEGAVILIVVLAFVLLVTATVNTIYYGPALQKSDSLGTLISGGLPIVQAIEITSDVVGNMEYKSILKMH